MKNLKVNKSARGFTLIEIMVATVIMVVLVGLVIQITSEVLKVWNRSSGKLSANAEARIAMELLTQDLETAVLRNNDQQWLRVESPQNPGGPYEDQTVALKLFSPALDRDESSAGDICGIAYRLFYQPAYDGATDNVYALYRSIARPDDTFNHLMGSSSMTESPQSQLVGPSTGAIAGFWGDDAVTDEKNYLAGNIVDFKVILYEDDGSGEPEPINWDPAQGRLVAGAGGAFAFGGTSQDLITNPLLFAEIRLTVLSDQGLEILENMAGSGYDDVDDVVREHGDVFVRRVNFMARPL
ncbi:prepilin-type N-terminal cleavage/methylation domain-containing protein [Coraliomargarita sp. SDUM461004]|uniref:Prepilin-type N-terminal cleavage/methylation domain-containing protein n=1 Tax=Thalassobacterium sedimentorum TaxID=3041258 RepID=A0ABU1ALQ8_9BACT|nr:prepilin-type N-terminal cleavage/methylation domain-containing protein [Coraliomargarita sp. SDUM461004]MDQ8194706.1 prepilin-type N-terminal cleavage/methylation domain-containing protein [Coraliomargarita sp. SDUM461004]